MISSNDTMNELGNGRIAVEHDPTFYSCAVALTLKQIVQLLKQQPCVQIIEPKDTHQIVKRNTDAGNVDIHALQTTINDHRTMINYLINNSINTTFVTDAIRDHHSKTGPILSSWRDLIDICTVTLLVVFLIYYCICRTGFTPCDKIISYFCQPIITRTTQLEPQPLPSTSTTTVFDNSSLRKPSQQQRRRPPHSSVASIEGDIVRFNHGYTSE